MTANMSKDLFAELGAPDTSIDARKAVLSKLLASRAFQKNPTAPEVEQAMQAWAGVLSSDESNDAQKLLGVSELVRMGASAPTLSPAVDKLLEGLLRAGLPRVDLASEADVRLNVAKAAKTAMPPWVIPYAAHGIATEDKGDKARAEFTSILAESTATLGDALGFLRNAFESLSFPTDDPAKVSARRGAKALEEIRHAYVAKGLVPGADFGASLDSFLLAVNPKGELRDDKVASELALQVIQLVQVAVRSRFSVATMPDTFLALRRARKIFPGARWPSRLKQALQPLASDIKEAIVILAKQGVSNQALLQQLETVLGSREEAKRETASLVANTPDIPEDVKHFLVHWKAKLDLSPSGAGLEETALQQLDTVLAQALRHDVQSRPDPARVKYVEESVGLFDPDAFSTFEQVVARAERFQRSIAELSTRRGLALLGIVGESMPASAKYFASKSGQATSVVLLPAVVRLRPDGSPGACILKGQLE